MKKFLLNLPIMAKLRFIPVKAQSILMLIYMASAALFMNCSIAKWVYHLIDPQTTPTKWIALLISVFVILLICGFIIGIFTKKDEKNEM